MQTQYLVKLQMLCYNYYLKQNDQTLTLSQTFIVKIDIKYLYAKFDAFSRHLFFFQKNVKTKNFLK